MYELEQRGNWLFDFSWGVCTEVKLSELFLSQSKYYTYYKSSKACNRKGKTVAVEALTFCLSINLYMKSNFFSCHAQKLSFSHLDPAAHLTWIPLSVLIFYFLVFSPLEIGEVEKWLIKLLPIWVKQALKTL